MNLTIPEPKDNAPIQEKHDVILVPCVGLDNEGNRIGYGQGFYDKYLVGEQFNQDCTFIFKTNCQVDSSYKQKILKWTG